MVLIATATLASGGAGSRLWHLQDDGLALSGFDPVEYLDFGLALRGFVDIETRYQGARFRFRSEHNLNRFRSDPERYLPAYGGWCAYGMGSDGSGDFPAGRYPPDPQNFEIIQGRLFLFYREPRLDARALWNRDPGRFRAAADLNWARMNR